MRELNDAVQATAGSLSREVQFIAECDGNDIRTAQPPVRRGYGFTAQWNDDFHHPVHAVLTKEGSGYYQDFGKVSQIAKTLTSGYVYQGEYARYRLRAQGFPPGVLALRAKSLHYYRAALGRSPPF